MASRIKLVTSGTTGEQKIVEHYEKDLIHAASQLQASIGLSSKDTILNIFPSWTIAHWVFVVYLARVSDAQVISIPFEPKTFWLHCHNIKPTFFPVAIRTLRTLIKLAKFPISWKMQCLTGSDIVVEKDFENCYNIGVEAVWHVYGSTEFPPPIFISKNTTKFNLKENLTNKKWYFNRDGELIIDDKSTGDIFDLTKSMFDKRIKTPINKTWKS